jgi:aryl-alcohol dehydrogenase-like predicted oxidoreductase
MEARGNREDVFLITKGGLSTQDPCCLAVEDLEEEIEADLTESLERLRTDYVDLYFLHRDAPEVPAGRMVECLNRELERGRIRAFGGSNWEPCRIDEANEYARQHGLVGFAAVSNNLSLAVPTGPYYRGLVSTDEAGQRWHAETGLPLFSWSAQARGFFSGRFRPDVRDNPDMVRVYYTDENFERLRRATQLGQEKGGYSAVQVALAYVLHLPLPVVPIAGPLTTEEMASCLAALQIELSDAEVRWLNLETESA